MRKTNAFVLFLLLFNFSIYSQIIDAESRLRSSNADTVIGWKKGGIVNLNFSQASFNNWAAGGQNSISMNGIISTFINYRTNKTSWDNMLDIGYGLLQQGKKGFIKTDDKIDLTSKYGREASQKWYYALLLNFKTQMTPGYNYPNDSVKISDFLAPAYLLGALGMDYKPDTSFTCFIAPLTLKTTIVNNTPLADAGAFGVTPAKYDTATNTVLQHGKKIRNELGGYVRIVYKRTFFKDRSVSLLSKLDLFSNYLHNPQNIDVSWETIIGFKVNKFISASITTHLLYDDDIKIKVDNNRDGITDVIGPRTQFKEVIGIGFSYKF
jgi:hypothetical protein